MYIENWIMEKKNVFCKKEVTMQVIKKNLYEVRAGPKNCKERKGNID